MTDLTDQDDKAIIRAIGLGPDNAGPTGCCKCAEYRAAIRGVLGMAKQEAETSIVWSKAVILLESILEAK